jgi:AcrR family transcriptional regulator
VLNKEERTMSANHVRLSADERRRQLIGIGLRLLTSKPIHEVTIDEVAQIAGISRGLLFHYFPTKRDYHVAIVAAAGRRLLRATLPGPEVDPQDRLHWMVDTFVGFIQRRREPYLALALGRSGGDWIAPIWDQVRDQLVERTLAETDAPDHRLTRLAVRGWVAMVEEVSVAWSRTAEPERARIVSYLVAALHDLLARATAGEIHRPGGAETRPGRL